jgi:hypothetical protein
MSILSIHFSLHTPIDFLFYFIFSLNITLCEKDRVWIKEEEREKEGKVNIKY